MGNGNQRPIINCPLCGKRVRVGNDHACPANAAADQANRLAHTKSQADELSEDDTEEDQDGEDVGTPTNRSPPPPPAPPPPPPPAPAKAPAK